MSKNVVMRILGTIGNIINGYEALIRRRKILSVRLFLTICIALFTAITFFHQKQLFDNLSTGARDLSFFTQPLWNFIHGNGLRTTIGWNGEHLFSEHFYLTHVLWSAVYYFWSSPYALFLIQGVMLGLAGIALYRIAQAMDIGITTSMLLMSLLLCHPSFHGASSGINLYGYHPDSLFPVFFLFAFDAHLRKRKATFWILVLMAPGHLSKPLSFSPPWPSIGFLSEIERSDWGYSRFQLAGTLSLQK
jgi:uncharacterized membrane protein